MLLPEHGAHVGKLVQCIEELQGCLPRTKIRSGVGVVSASLICDVDILVVASA